MALIAFGLAICSAQSQALPTMAGKNLNGKVVTLPSSSAGKVSILVMGFSNSASKPALEWTAHLHTWASGLGAEVVVYRLPVLEEVPNLFRAIAIGRISRSTPQQEREFVVPLFQDEAIIKQTVQFASADDAYVLLVDRHGLIRWKSHDRSAIALTRCEAEAGRLLASGD